MFIRVVGRATSPTHATRVAGYPSAAYPGTVFIGVIAGTALATNATDRSHFGSYRWLDWAKHKYGSLSCRNSREKANRRKSDRKLYLHVSNLCFVRRFSHAVCSNSRRQSKRIRLSQFDRMFLCVSTAHYSSPRARLREYDSDSGSRMKLNCVSVDLRARIHPPSNRRQSGRSSRALTPRADVTS
jgi:hypothetical protein